MPRFKAGNGKKLQHWHLRNMDDWVVGYLHRELLSLHGDVN